MVLVQSDVRFVEDEVTSSRSYFTVHQLGFWDEDFIMKVAREIEECFHVTVVLSPHYMKLVIFGDDAHTLYRVREYLREIGL